MNRAAKQNNNIKRNQAVGSGSVDDCDYDDSGPVCTPRVPAGKRSTACAPTKHQGRHFSAFRLCQAIYLVLMGAIVLGVLACGVRFYMTDPTPSTAILPTCPHDQPGMPRVCLMSRRDHGSRATHQHWVKTSAEYRRLCGEGAFAPRQPTPEEKEIHAVMGLSFLFCILLFVAPCLGMPIYP